MNDEIDQLRRLVELDPKSGLSHLTYGRALLRAGDATTALQELETAIRIDADLLVGYLFCGQAAEKLSRPGAAKLFYRAGIQAAERLGDAGVIAQLKALLATIA